MPESSLSRRIAECLLTIRAFRFSPDAPFLWASGLRSPIYCDNRLIISYPAVRRLVRDGFAELWRDHGVQAGLIAATATAGIPHAAWLADLFELPMVYVRSRAKEHGLGSRIEGNVGEGRRVRGRTTERPQAVVIEDLVTTGGSSRRVVKALQQAGVEVQAVLAVFSYELSRARQTFSEMDVPLYALTGFDDLVRVAQASGRLPETAIRTIRGWHADPEQWSLRHG